MEDKARGGRSITLKVPMLPDRQGTAGKIKLMGPVFPVRRLEPSTTWGEESCLISSFSELRERLALHVLLKTTEEKRRKKIREERRRERRKKEEE